MKNFQSKVAVFFAAFLLSLSLSLAVAVEAVEVDDVLAVGAKKTAAARSSQQRIDTLADQTSDLFQTFKQVNKQIEDLQIYNTQLAAQVANQQQSIADLESSIDNATVMERQITPLVLKMIDSLEQFINLDFPFLMEERHTRVAKLRENLMRADLSAAEKFRQVLEAYKIETEYGVRIDSYLDTLSVGGQEREVSILRVGRIALMYQTPDQQATGAWDQESRQWLTLDDGSYRSAVAEGLRIARKQTAIDILSLPVSAPEVVQ